MPLPHPKQERDNCSSDRFRFVLLEDCGHVMEVENMDNLMKSDSEIVKIRCCPFCRKPIINTGRYKDLVNATFKNEINVIKTQVYGTKKSIDATMQKLIKDLKIYYDKYNKDLRGDNFRLFWDVFLNLNRSVKSKRNVSKLQLDMELMCLNVLDMITECYKSYFTNKATQLKDELVKQTQLLCSIFVFKSGALFKISEQQQKDVKLEIARLNAIIQLAKLTSHVAYAQTKHTDAVATAFKAANAAVFKPAAFKEAETTAALKHLQNVVKASDVVVTIQERQMIVKAIGLKGGHWYKCPNGHPYCIGECGGATQVGRCNVCRAEIGGTGHRLAAGNAHAPEIDGSRFAAWSEEYNNMANFNLD